MTIKNVNGTAQLQNSNAQKGLKVEGLTPMALELLAFERQLVHMQTRLSVIGNGEEGDAEEAILNALTAMDTMADDHLRKFWMDEALGMAESPRAAEQAPLIPVQAGGDRGNAPLRPGMRVEACPFGWSSFSKGTIVSADTAGCWVKFDDEEEDGVDVLPCLWRDVNVPAEELMHEEGETAKGGAA